MGALLFYAGGAAVMANAVRIEIPIFAGGYGVRFFEETARAFESERPGVSVNLYGDPRIGDQVRIRIIEGTYPNATDAWGVPWNNLIRAGKLLDLAPWLDGPNWEEDARWADTFLPGALERWREGDQVWAVPFAYAAYVIFYNKGLFEEQGWTIPRTWDELFALCDAIQEQGIAPFAFPGIYQQYADWILRAAHYNLAGPEEYRAYQEMVPGTRASPAFKGAAEVVQRLATQHFQPGWQGMSHTAAQLQLFDGKAAMMANGSWLVSEMQGKIPDDFELGAFNFPIFTDGRGETNAVQIGSGYYFLFAEVPHTETTVDFFRFLTSRSRAAAFAAAQDTPAAVRGIPPDVFSPGMRDVVRIIETSSAAYGVPPGTSTDFPGMVQAFTDARYLLLRGEIDAETFGDRLEAAAERSRAALIEPDAVVIRHRWPGLLLLCFLFGTVAFTLVMRRGGANRNGGPDRYHPTRMLGARHALLFIAPALLLYLLFVLKPSVEALAWAFTEWDGITERRFVGLLHFKRLLFESDVFWRALRNNLFIMFVPACFVLPMALFFSYLISRGVPGGRLFRVCFFFPNILGGIAVTLLWMNAYDPQGGLVNGVLTRLGFDSFENFAWLSQENLYWALIPMAIWGACGFNMILYLAGMESVDPELYEASAIDGATGGQQFFYITLPLIWDVLTISAVFMVIGGLKSFEVIWLLTSQQPTTRTHVMGTLMVTTMFQDFKVGQATAIAVVLFLLVFFGTLATLRGMRRERVEAG